MVETEDLTGLSTDGCGWCEAACAPGSSVCEALARGPRAGQVLVPLVAWTEASFTEESFRGSVKLSTGGRPGAGELILHRACN